MNLAPEAPDALVKLDTILCYHRHLRKKDLLMACTACLVYLISTVSGRSKNPKMSLEEAALVAGT